MAITDDGRICSTGRGGWQMDTELMEAPYTSKTKRKKQTTNNTKSKVASKMELVVLPTEIKAAITETLSQAHKDVSDMIFKQWGFDSTIEKGKGIIMLFWGKPGTGKTMCAEAIADKIGKDYVLLSTKDFQSSIPGETERNIQKAFATAKAKNLVVILDECDSVVFSREEVGAIIAAEVNCLLTEIERFEGVCIMTTNRSIRLDAALERRVALKLEFPSPNKENRAAIWRKLIPLTAPLSKDVNFKKLAEFELSGGQIKNAILNGARRAASRNDKHITQKDFLEGIQREILGEKMWSKTTPKHFLYQDANLPDRWAKVDVVPGKDKTLNVVREPKVEKTKGDQI